MPKYPKVTIVVPCFNEESRFQSEEILAFVKTRHWLQFILIDDGSTDNTKETLMRTAAEGGGRISAVILEQNVGKAEAVRQGMVQALRSDAEHVGFWDADLATPLSDIDRFAKVLRERPDIDIVIGSRVQLLGRDIRRNKARHLFGRIAATAASNVLGLNVYDTQCGAKLFRSSPLMQDLMNTRFITRWIFDVELLARWTNALRDQGVSRPEDKIVEIPLECWVDVAGSKLRPKDMALAPLELAKIYWRYRNQNKKDQF